MVVTYDLPKNIRTMNDLKGDEDRLWQDISEFGWVVQAVSIDSAPEACGLAFREAVQKVTGEDTVFAFTKKPCKIARVFFAAASSGEAAELISNDLQRQGTLFSHVEVYSVSRDHV